MKRTLISALGCFALSLAVPAQNLNPTVEVTNAYEHNASGIDKPSQLREVPDSILHFNLDFDYAVKETPYQGAYEFSPYLIQPRPGGEPSSERSLYLSAGLGYTLHPEVMAVWTPVKTERLRVNLFGSHVCYIGPYHNLVVDAGGHFAPDGTSYLGKELHSGAGGDFRLHWSRGVFSGELDYGHNLVTAPWAGGDLSGHRLHGKARLSGLPGAAKVDYDLKLDYAFNWGQPAIRESRFSADGQVGFRLLRRKWQLGVQSTSVFQPEGTATCLQFTFPRFRYGSGALSLTAGVKVAFMLRSAAAFAPTRPGHIFPDVQLRWEALPQNLVLYGSVTGGNELQSYDLLQERNPFVAGMQWYTDVQVQRVLATVGARGQIARRFSYDVNTGFSRKENMALWGTIAGLPALCYADIVSTWFVQGKLGWKSPHLDFSARLKWVRILNKPNAVATGQLPFTPPTLSGEAHAFYLWRNRIRAGVTLQARNEMLSPAGDLPGYLDLGAQGAFQMDSRLGFWLKLGNLLGQPVQRVPLIAEKGLYFTVGASWNL